MKRLFIAYMVAGVCGCWIGARPSLAVDVHIGVAIPPPPSIVFEHEPQVVVVPHSDVYYAPDVPDYDMYRHGRYWYANRDGYWYRAQTYRGPFVAVEVARVPRAIVGVPTGFRHYPSRPPGHHHEEHHSNHHHDDHHDHDGHHH